MTALNTETWRLEPRVVTNAFATGRKPVYRLRTRLGRTIRATGNHKFLSFSGWRRLDDLGPGARIALPRRTDGPYDATMSEEEVIRDARARAGALFRRAGIDAASPWPVH